MHCGVPTVSVSNALSFSNGVGQGPPMTVTRATQRRSTPDAAYSVTLTHPKLSMVCVPLTKLANPIHPKSASTGTCSSWPTALVGIFTAVNIITQQSFATITPRSAHRDTRGAGKAAG